MIFRIYSIQTHSIISMPKCKFENKEVVEVVHMQPHRYDNHENPHRNQRLILIPKWVLKYLLKKSHFFTICCKVNDFTFYISHFINKITTFAT